MVYNTTRRCLMERKIKRKSHSREFKLEAVKRSYEVGKTIAEVARELDVRENDLHEWRYQVSEKGGVVFPGSGRKSANNDNELAQLKEENARLREERDILKKSLIFFAKDDNKGSNS